MVETMFRVLVMMSSAVLFVALAMLVVLKGTSDAALATVRAVTAATRRRVAGSAARRGR